MKTRSDLTNNNRVPRWIGVGVRMAEPKKKNTNSVTMKEDRADLVINSRREPSFTWARVFVFFLRTSYTFKKYPVYWWTQFVVPSLDSSVRPWNYVEHICHCNLFGFSHLKSKNGFFYSCAFSLATLIFNPPIHNRTIFYYWKFKFNL